MKNHILNIILLITFFITGIGIALANSLTVESETQEFKDNESKIYLEGNVKVKSGGVNVLSPKAVVEINPNNNKVENVEFTDNAYTYYLEEGKKHEIKAQIINVSLLKKIYEAKGNSITTVTENEKPMVIVTADKQEYHKEANTMKAFGNVNILYKDIETFSQEATVNLNANNDVKKITLSGNSKLKQNKNTINAKKVIYDNVKEEAVATGNVYTHIVDEDNKNIEIWSDYQSYDKKDNFVTAAGGTKIKYEDYNASGPKLNVFTDKKTKKLNEAIFVGRSKIETKGRTIEADRIAITMNPKNFKAEGNVKSTIQNLGGNGKF